MNDFLKRHLARIKRIKDLTERANIINRMDLIDFEGYLTELIESVEEQIKKENIIIGCPDIPHVEDNEDG